MEDRAASTATLGQAGDAEVEAECDVIVKGGITSGVIYPLAICELATRYQIYVQHHNTTVPTGRSGCSHQTRPAG